MFEALPVDVGVQIVNHTALHQKGRSSTSSATGKSATWSGVGSEGRNTTALPRPTYVRLSLRSRSSFDCRMNTQCVFSYWSTSRSSDTQMPMYFLPFSATKILSLGMSLTHSDTLISSAIVYCFLKVVLTVVLLLRAGGKRTSPVSGSAIPVRGSFFSISSRSLMSTLRASSVLYISFSRLSPHIE